MHAAVLSLLLALPTAVAPSKPADAWNFSAYLDGYMELGEEGYLVPTVFAERGPVHLEARYNYEDFNTASLFFGWTFQLGNEDTLLKVRPMLGGVAGLVNGMSPGLEIEAHWWRLSYWLEGEYFFNFADGEENYLYTWSELNFDIVPSALWVGGSFQRLKLVDTGSELDAGPMVGVSVGNFSLSFYFYGLWTESRWGLMTISLYL